MALTFVGYPLLLEMGYQRPVEFPKSYPCKHLFIFTKSAQST
jgi:hypothetical protein